MRAGLLLQVTLKSLTKEKASEEGKGKEPQNRLRRGLLGLFFLLGPLGLSPSGDLRRQHKLNTSESSCRRNRMEGWFFTSVVS